MRSMIHWAALVIFVMSGPATFAEPPQAGLRSFLEANCLDCHQGAEAEAGLDLARLDADLAKNFSTWVRIHDRVNAGEMPPPEDVEIESAQVKRFVEQSGQWLRDYQQHQDQLHGRVRGRRLNNVQVERTLHDLLGVDVPLANQLPEDPKTGGFTTVADGQSMSHFQLESHLTVVDAALDEAFRRALTPPDESKRRLDARTLSRRRPKSRTREPELINGRAVTWSSRLIFYGRLPSTTARESGWYRFTIRASALKSPADHGVWCTVRSGRCVSSAPLLADVGAFEATNKPKEVTFEAWIPQGHMLEIRPGDATLKMARFRGGQVGTGEGGPQNVPGVALEWIDVERFHQGPNDQRVREILFDDLKVKIAEKKWHMPAVASANPEKDVARLVYRFAQRAFRRPVDEADVEPFVEMALQKLAGGADLIQALRTGYRALLCSPRFLYFHETPGKLDDYAVANRLSYFLWNTMPDDELMQLAAVARLRDPKVLDGQVGRMLYDSRGRRFVKDFAAQWLDLSLIDFTEPDRKLYPGFDVVVQQSMLAETHAFLQKILDDDMSVRNLIDSDFTYLNSRLARYYGIRGVSGDELRRFALRPEHRRGGVLTQGAILKVTANGTATSPVIRGVWVSERLLGEPIPDPPKNVPAVEPDIRGAKTIREMLAKHKSDVSCASCHVKIDPPGFALENYDPSGRWRDHYLRIDRRRRQRGAAVDASFRLPDGRPFNGVDEFRRLIASDEERLARNVAEKLLVYGTGAPIRFADRPALDAVVRASSKDDFGMRSILQAVVSSPVFLSK